MSLLSEQQVANIRHDNQETETITAEASGSAGNLNSKFNKCDRIVYSISNTVSVNNSMIQATIDGTNYFTIVHVSGTGVTSGSFTNNYSGIDFYVNSWSSGSVQGDFLGKY